MWLWVDGVLIAQGGQLALFSDLLFEKNLSFNENNHHLLSTRCVSDILVFVSSNSLSFVTIL